MSSPCPACNSGESTAILELQGAAVNSVVLIHDQAEARAFRTGEILLRGCADCGFVWNAAFDPKLAEYGEGYEATQAYSPTFNTFHQRIVDDLVSRHDLMDGSVVEIGCGQGEFLELLSQAGVDSAVGYDPAFDRSRTTDLDNRVVIFAERFEDAVIDDSAPNLVCCKMTLEHIGPVSDFVLSIRQRLVGDRTVTMIQVPNLLEIARTGAFWDVYYEHCSYFTPSSIQKLMESSGFDDVRTWTDYDDQYLFVESGSASDLTSATSAQAEPPDWDMLATRMSNAISSWRSRIERHDGPVVLWGGGSKAVSFLAAVGDAASNVISAVDINPLKHDTFLPVTGLPVVAPAFLLDHPGALVVALNPIYRDEIAEMLAGLGAEVVLETIEDPLEVEA